MEQIKIFADSDQLTLEEKINDFLKRNYEDITVIDIIELASEERFNSKWYKLMVRFRVNVAA